MKIEARQPIHSRRLSKNSPVYENQNLENGVDSNQNGLVPVKRAPLTTSIGTGNEPDTLTNGVKPISTNSVTMEATPNAVVNDLKNALHKVGAAMPIKSTDTVLGQEIANLKDLLILNLDLIQHQQQLLIARDRQIKTLTVEKDALRNRLERMERRMSLLKQKPDADLTETVKSTDVQSPVTPASKQTNKRKSTAKLKSETPRKQQRRSAIIKPEESPAKPEEPHHSLRSSDPPPPEPVSPKTTPVRQTRLQHNIIKDKMDLVRTSEHFYVPVTEFHDPEIVGKVVKSPNRKAKIKVEVPKWRFHPVSNCYQMEGTEITDDEVYLKRHLKFENDEKRRKRWDIQRLREQTAYQKLVASRTAVTRSERLAEPKPVTTLHPNPEHIRYIEVSETIPVGVFGYPLPKVAASDFAVKWPEKVTTEPKEPKSTKKRR